MHPNMKSWREHPLLTPHNGAWLGLYHRASSLRLAAVDPQQWLGQLCSDEWF